jgi:hypothetical protein
MNKGGTQVQQTQHAFLIACGWFDEHTGLSQVILKFQFSLANQAKATTQNLKVEK